MLLNYFRSLSFTQKFFILSSLILFILGISLNLIIPPLVQNNIIIQSSEVTAEITNASLRHNLELRDLKEPATGERYDEISKLIDEDVLSPYIVAIKIWREDGMVLFSNYRPLVGKKFSPGRRINQAFAGQVVVEVTDLREEENICEKGLYDRLLSIYSPLTLEGSQDVDAVFEIYFDLSFFDQAFLKVRSVVLLLSILGLVVLELSLYGTAHTASRTIRKQADELREDLISTIDTLVRLIEVRDHYTGEHSKHLSEGVKYIAERLKLKPPEIRDITIAAVLHDVGKIGIDDTILNKPGKLKNEEFEEIKKHSSIGESALGVIRKLEKASQIIRHHHEHYDGNGYPDSLRGEDIPVGSRIISVVDAYDAMTSDRPYRKAMPREEAISILKKEKGRQFDPQLIDIFLEYL